MSKETAPIEWHGGKNAFNGKLAKWIGSVWRFETGCFVDKDTREVYMVTPELWPIMQGAVTPTALVVTVSRNSPIPFLWSLVYPNPYSDERGLEMWSKVNGILADLTRPTSATHCHPAQSHEKSYWVSVS